MAVVKASDELESEDKMTKTVIARPASEHPVVVSLEMGEPPGGDGVLASDELASEDKSAIIEIVKTDVEAPGESESKDNGHQGDDAGGTATSTAAFPSVGEPPTVSAVSTKAPTASAQRETGAPTAAPIESAASTTAPSASAQRETGAPTAARAKSAASAKGAASARAQTASAKRVTGAPSADDGHGGLLACGPAAQGDDGHGGQDVCPHIKYSGVRATGAFTAAPTKSVTSAKGAASTTSPVASARFKTGAPTAAPTKQPLTKTVTTGPAGSLPGQRMSNGAGARVARLGARRDS